MYAHVGDRLIAEGDAARSGLIIGVPHDDGSPPYIVKWLSDGHIAMVWPGDFARVVPGGPPAPNGQPRSATGALPPSEQRARIVGNESL
ncbi:MAG TPA: DUF1918 domain-containing protein [Streptosporangiaceae bacterium]|nr:DUF1918 domain-containing protein [Streptosporangiaceae bacterium]